MKKIFLVNVSCLLIFTSYYISAQTNSDNSNQKQHVLLDPSNYHQIRGGIKNAYIKFERDKKGRVAFLGGSITYNHGWRDSVCAYLVKRFPETDFDFVEAGVPSMGTTSAAFRLERDVLSKGKIDLLFEEAAVNDAGKNRTTKELIKGMEGIVRHCRMTNPEIDIVMMHFVDPEKIESYNNGLEPEVIAYHNKVAEHYNIPAINLAKEVTDRINNGEFTWKDDFKNLHPSPFGQGVYARSIILFLDNAFEDYKGTNYKVTPHNLPDKIDSNCYDKGYFVEISDAELTDGWNIDTLWNPNDGKNTRPNYVDVPMLICEKPGSTLKLNFEGTAVGIVAVAGHDAGTIEYRIDNKEWKELNLFTKHSHNLHLPWYYTLSSDLSPEKHILEICTTNTKDPRSTGNACRIRYFYVNKF